MQCIVKLIVTPNSGTRYTRKTPENCRLNMDRLLFSHYTQIDERQFVCRQRACSVEGAGISQTVRTQAMKTMLEFIGGSRPVYCEKFICTHGVISVQHVYALTMSIAQVEINHRSIRLR